MKASALIFEEFFLGGQPMAQTDRAEAYDAYCRWAMYGEEYTGNNIAIRVLLASVSKKVKKADAEYKKKSDVLSEARSEAGKQGAAARWGKREKPSDAAAANDGKVCQPMVINDKNGTVNVSDSVGDTEVPSNPTDTATFANANVRHPDVQRSGVDAIVDEWNTLPEPIPHVKKLVPGSARDKQIKARIREYGIDDALQAIDNVRASPFLSGQRTDFVAKIDWVFGPKNFPKVLDGNYADTPRETTRPGQKREEIIWIDNLTERGSGLL